MSNSTTNFENLYHGGAIGVHSAIFRRRSNSPEARKLVEKRDTLARQGVMRRRYDPQLQRPVPHPHDQIRETAKR